MRRMLLALASLFVVPVAMYACAGDDPAAPGPKDHSKDPPPPESGATDSSTTDAAADGPRIVQDCKQTDFDAPINANGGDFTAADGGVTIGFPFGATPAQYTNRCAKLKVGQNVTFSGNFELHPLTPKGGDTPTPIPNRMTNEDGGAPLSIALSTKGTFGFECGEHAFMRGAIQVVP